MKLFICQYCGRETTNPGANKVHENHCEQNPQRKNKSEKWVESMKSRKGSGENQYTKADKLGLPKPIYDRSHLPIVGCAAWSKEKRSQAAKDQGFGGYRENAGRSKKFRVKDSFNNEVVLQSTYELECSEILNKLGIIWIRPKHLKYANDKKYFADFYLPDYEIYLDPKNDYKAKLDEDKINSVIEINNVKVFILTKNMLTEDYIKMLVSPNGEGLA